MFIAVAKSSLLHADLADTALPFHGVECSAQLQLTAQFRLGCVVQTRLYAGRLKAETKEQILSLCNRKIVLQTHLFLIELRLALRIHNKGHQRKGAIDLNFILILSALHFSHSCPS